MELNKKFDFSLFLNGKLNIFIFLHNQSRVNDFYTGMATACFVFVTSAPIRENEFDRQGEGKQQKESTE